jgi:predicted nucleic acid-binding protein
VARIFLDANVFLYALGGESPHRGPCRDLLTAAGDGAVDTVTSTEVLQEILHVRARRVSVRDAAEAVRAAAELVAEVLPVTKDDVLLACRLCEKQPALGGRDAIHAAVMKNNLLHVIASLDRDFDLLKEVRRVSPAEALAR